MLNVVVVLSKTVRQHTFAGSKPTPMGMRRALWRPREFRRP